MAEVQETINELVGKMVQSESGKWTLPEDVSSDLDPAIIHAVNAERRVRDTQAAFTKNQQELARQRAIAEGLSQHLVESATMHLTDEQRADLEELKKSDPEAWREKLNTYEQESKTLLQTKLAEIKENGAKQSELELRKARTEAFKEATGIELTDDIVNNELPPKYVRQLEAGEITFEQFLTNAAAFLTANKVIEGSTTPDTELEAGTTLSNLPGGREPAPSAQAQDDSQSYAKTVF